MHLISEKIAVIDLIKQNAFYEALLLQSTEQYDTKSSAFKSLFLEHHSDQFADQADGVRLLSTPMKSMGWGEGWGVWFAVSRQYEAPEPSYGNPPIFSGAQK